mgnify:CR=1 FL=1
MRWPWSKPTQVRVPAGYFISHSYQDAEAREHLLRTLPPAMKPFIFPPITARPDQFVSNELIAAILRCEGLIYLEGGASANSFWVAFERDYALRARKPVFAFDPHSYTLRQDQSSPLQLRVFPSYSHRDVKRVQRILEFMRHERYFDLWIDSEQIRASDRWELKLLDGIEQQLAAGGYLVAFISAASMSTAVITQEWGTAFESNPGRVLPALLDNVPLTGTVATIQALQLYGDRERSEIHRLDDLIVRLYWLIYRNTRQNGLD